MITCFTQTACYASSEKYDLALQDAEKCIEIKPEFGKGYARKGLAEYYLHKYEEAIATYTRGLELEPANAQMKEGLEKAETSLYAAPGGPGGLGGDMNSPFFGADAIAKLMANPKTAAYFSDPSFVKMFEMGKSNPQMFMQLVQFDPRFKEVMSTILGFDLDTMSQQVNKERGSEEEGKKNEETDPKKKVDEEARWKKAESDKNLNAEEKSKKDKKLTAEEHKLRGNAAYKAKDFNNSIAEYSKAIEINPEELLYYTNKAASLIEQGEYQKCIDECLEGLKAVSHIAPDFQKVARAYSRIASAYGKLEKFDEAIEYYGKALVEHTDQSYKDALKLIHKIKKEKEDEAYLNPEIAEKHREAGNKLFEQGTFPDAIKEYSEGLRRDPKNIRIFSNRCAAYIKLMEYPRALDDANKCIEMDPKFIKAYARKGTIQNLMKEFHKALDTYEKGLKLDPTNKECQEGKMRTLQAINTGSHAGSEQDDERTRHAMADPEIRTLLMDPRIQQVLKDFQENPAAAQAALKDKFIGTALEKLIAAGILKTK